MKPPRVTRPHLPPGRAPASSTVTACPAAASRTAAASPPTPAPTTTTLIAQPPPQRRDGERAHRGRARRGHPRAPPQHRVGERLADPGPRVQRERAVVARVRRVVVERDQTANTPSARDPPAEEVRRRHALVAPAARPRPVALARHARVEEDVPGGERARGERHARRPARGQPARRDPRRPRHHRPRRRGQQRHAADARPELARVGVVRRTAARWPRRPARRRSRARPPRRSGSAPRRAPRASTASAADVAEHQRRRAPRVAPGPRRPGTWP